MSHPCPRCGVPAPVVVSSDGALPPELVMADEAARLREALEQVAKACICGGKGRRMYWPECRLCEDSGEDHACPEQREIDCPSRQCGIARAALATAKAKGG